VSRAVQQFVASYLVLCLALAGAVGISPVLHQLVEHGGHGDAHVHVGTASHPQQPGFVHRHEHGLEHSHDAAPGQHQVQDSGRPGLFVHSVRGIETSELVRRAWQFVESIFDSAVEQDDPSPDSDKTDHEHHSLAQLLASGLAESSVDLPLLEAEFGPVIFGLASPDMLVLSVGWNAQTASRGPPLLC
jgi:hypothetical protein